ncbi:acyl-CoA dehydrogenase family protein [Paraburkholderia strydomiana]|uniref:acyl-CoA dehydrogenase family protein n=1 Tax=Paraburkholderia strydomiana TaxID=1245417 RepID=UPI0038BADDCA
MSKIGPAPFCYLAVCLDGRNSHEVTSMPTYTAPLREYAYLLEHVLDYSGTVASLPGYQDATFGLVEAVIGEGARLAEKELAPLNRSGDEDGCLWANGKVRTPKGFKDAYALYCDSGWPALTASPEYGGQGLPHVVGLILREMVSAANMSFGTYAGLSQGAIHAISTHGSEDLKQRFLPRLIEGRWTGTMCLTEPHCGSDLGLLRTRAEAIGDGNYRITGTKIFVTGGEHDLSENIVHLVLARLPDAPAGIKGISLFAVPKLLQTHDKSWTKQNSVECTGIEHKMGIRASATASLVFDGATGWLIGEPNRGMKAMFTMMNTARLGVSVQAVALAEGALQCARSYALERRQGRAVGGGTQTAPVAIISHADVRRNLLTGKSFVEGARALWLWAGIQLDRSHKHPDPAVQSECEDLLALLTPVLKAFFSDRSFQATNAAVQVFGGHGYIRETGVEQFVRDGRIIPLYEGTNGIQALDLVSRKLTLNEGKTASHFFELVRDEIRGISELRPGSARDLEAALEKLQWATDFIRTGAEADPHLNGSVGHDYLQLFGLVALGFAWAKITRASLSLTQTADMTLANEKLKVADFFFARVLPEAERFYRLVETGSAPLMALEDDEF